MTIANSQFINRRRLVPAEPAKVSYWREKINDPRTSFRLVIPSPSYLLISFD